MPSPRRYRYGTVDVFTTRQFEGNQVSVFPEAAGVLEALWHPYKEPRGGVHC